MQLSHKVATGISIEFGYLLLVSLQCPTASRIPPPNPTPPLLPCFLMGLSISRVWKCQTNDKVSQCQGQYSINVETFEDYAYAKLGFGNHKKNPKTRIHMISLFLLNLVYFMNSTSRTYNLR